MGREAVAARGTLDMISRSPLLDAGWGLEIDQRERTEWESGWGLATLRRQGRNQLQATARGSNGPLLAVAGSQ